MKPFANKTAFVTGAGTGIGLASAKAFAREGANIFAVDFNPVLLGEAIDQIKEIGGGVSGAVADVRSAEQIDGAIKSAAATFGGIDFAHNNAGIVGDRAHVAEASAEQFREVMEVNLFGVLNCLRLQIPHMAARGGGAIVNTASTSGLLALPGLSSYVASKHAVVGLTKAAALDAAPQKVRINCICPGAVETELSRKWFESDPTVRDAVLAQHPIGWVCQPEDVAEAAVWLCSDKSAYVLGSSLVLDGGYSIS